MIEPGSPADRAAAGNDVADGGGNASGRAGLAAPSPRVRVPRLTSLAAVRREMARQYGLQLRGEVDSQVLTRRIYALSAIREAFREDELERRLAAMEKLYKP